ncbi:MAG: 3-hydroxyisobutyrate dehydrogenase [Gammaproteobacteria bacterium]|nr:3-hydroxyisobutyrate dehydrogenase [Gammaproteobacteria bacterium]
MTTIGFIGLGHMGNPMVQNLLKAGYKVKVYDVSTAAIESLVASGAIPTNSLADVAKESDVLITMLQTGEQVSGVCLGQGGIFAHARRDTLFIDCSSIEITITRELHNEAKMQNIWMLDAPVSGGMVGANAATLTFMVGGEESVFTTAKPILEKMGKKIIYAGKDGSGQAAKICNNLILGISMIAVSEGFNLAEKLGLDKKKFFEISSNASGQCWAMTSYCPAPDVIDNVPSNNEYKAGFAAKMMLKDLHLAQHAAETVDVAIPLASEATEMYTLFVNQGNGDLDFSAIIKMLADECK